MADQTKSVHFSPTCRGQPGLKVVTKNIFNDTLSFLKDDPLEETKRLMDSYTNEKMKNREVNFIQF